MFSRAGGQGKAGWLGVQCLNATSVVGQKGKQKQTLPGAGFISPKKKKKGKKRLQAGLRSHTRTLKKGETCAEEEGLCMNLPGPIFIYFF